MCNAGGTFGMTAVTAGNHQQIRGVNVHTYRRDVSIGHVLFDFAIALVIPNHDGHIQADFNRAGKFRQGELQTAVTNQADHRAVWASNFCAKCGR